jgi:hypothetical protein
MRRGIDVDARARASHRGAECGRDGEARRSGRRRRDGSSGARDGDDGKGERTATTGKEKEFILVLQSKVRD